MDLFLCTTPLQVCLAKYLSKDVKNPTLVYVSELARYDSFSPISKEKQSEYASRCDYWLKWQDLSLKELKGIVDSVSGSINSIYYASFDNPYIRKFVSELPDVSCYGFDDGLADVYSRGIYTKESATYLKSRVSRHYTLYNSPNHVVPKEKLVYLDFKNVFSLPKPISNGKKVTILLGEEVLANKELGISFNKPYLDTLNVDIYLPHPNSRFTVNDPRVIHTNLILEEYLIALLKEYEKVTIYHFSSSSAVHLKADGVEFRGIFVLPLNDLQQEMRKLGVKFEEIAIKCFI